MSRRKRRRILSAWGLDTQLPVYVTRKNADGETGSYTLSAWMILLVMLLVWGNLVVWGCLGFYEAIRVVIG